MADDRANPAGPDRIAVEQDAECRYWSEKLGVTPEELKRAVRHVGADLEEVKRFLAQGPGNTDPNGASHWRATSGL